MKPIKLKERFEKHYVQRIGCNPKLRKAYLECVASFKDGGRGYPLNDHALTGKLAGKRAFSVTSDIRVIYEELDDALVFLDIGTHSQVYN